jgi:hypothetical protein
MATTWTVNAGLKTATLRHGFWMPSDLAARS